MKQHVVYYGRISTTDGQTAATQHEEAQKLGIKPNLVFIDEGVSGYHIAPEDRPEWAKCFLATREGDVLMVRWLDRISRRYDELARVMRALMDKGVVVRCILNGMEFDPTGRVAVQALEVHIDTLDLGKLPGSTIVSLCHRFRELREVLRWAGWSVPA